MASPLPGRPVVHTARGASDATDGSTVFKGAMTQLANLVPNPANRGQWVPRPASNKIADFTTQFTAPSLAECFIELAGFAYGMIATGRFPGQSEPFAINLQNLAFSTIANVLSTNTPTSQPAAGDWVPPQMAVIGGRIIVTHSGFPGGATKFGWFDISAFSDTTHTGTTHSNTTLDTLSANVLLAGWQPGMTIAGTGIPAGATIISIASNGLSLVLSLAATASAGGVALTVAGGTATAPLWAAGDLNINNLAAVPVSVEQFNGRAYYAVPGSALAFSDAGFPCQATNATQVLQFRNGLDVTALGPLGLYSTTSGGLVESLIAFQGDQQMFQVQGDSTFTGGITVNQMNAGVGTLAPNTITPTPLGLAFVAPDGARMIDFTARVSDPIGIDGDGINEPFLNAITPSRMCAAYNQNTLRITVQNATAPGQAFQEWWLHFNEKVWSGPHSFPARLISALQQRPTALSGHGFIMFPLPVAASLWSSDPTPVSSSTYVENGNTLTFNWQTVLWPDPDDMSGHCVIESAIGLAMPPSAIFTIQAVSELGGTFDTVTLQGSGLPQALWGQVTWGNFRWGGQIANYRQYQIPWHLPIVFKQKTVMITGFSLSGIIIGNLYERVEDLDYLADAPAPFQPAVPPLAIAETEAGVPGFTEEGVAMTTESGR